VEISILSLEKETCFNLLQALSS